MYRLSRREFLAQLGLAAAGGVLVSCAPAGPAAPSGGVAAPAASEVVVPGAAAGEVAPGVPRTETLILENPTGRVNPADDFNR